MRIRIKNFRAIRDQEVELAPITVVYGPNGAGKSSLILALLSLRAAILSSNGATSTFFNYGFTSLGGFDAVVFDHLTSNKIDLSLQIHPTTNSFAQHGIVFGEGQGNYYFHGAMHQDFFNLDVPVSFPYPGNLPTTVNFQSGEHTFPFTWNGITAQPVAGQALAPEATEELTKILALINSPAELLRRLTAVPLKRGFSKPVYQTQPLSAALITEDEVATYLSSNKYLEAKVSHYLEKILNQDFRVHVQPGTAIFSLDATDKKTGLATELVNEGFGVNQMVYFLAKALNPDSLWTCVEEPEIHLHPSAVRRFAHALQEMVREDGKNFVISTHSEAFVLALLAMVAEGKLKTEQLACYFVNKIGKTATFEKQLVKETGQLEGGLTSFMSGEIEDLKHLIGLTAQGD